MTTRDWSKSWRKKLFLVQIEPKGSRVATTYQMTQCWKGGSSNFKGRRKQVFGGGSRQTVVALFAGLSISGRLLVDDDNDNQNQTIAKFQRNQFSIFRRKIIDYSKTTDTSLIVVRFIGRLQVARHRVLPLSCRQSSGDKTYNGQVPSLLTCGFEKPGSVNRELCPFLRF